MNVYFHLMVSKLSLLVSLSKVFVLKYKSLCNIPKSKFKRHIRYNPWSFLLGLESLGQLKL